MFAVKKRAPWLILVSLCSAIVALTGAAHAQCANSANPSCDVYPKCFAHLCPCEGVGEYFLSYGKKYCDKFLSLEFSGRAKVWRDSTLRCLQEKIVPRLPVNGSKACNCAAMRAFAFNTHVECYTKPGASICNLSWSDMAQVGLTISLRDVASTEGRETICKIARECEQQTSTTSGGDSVDNDVKRHLFWSGIVALCE